MNKTDIIVVGGGAAGLMAAGKIRERGGDVILFEKMNRTGKKLGITGKGRCNVTNNCDLQTLIANVNSNPRFLYGAFSDFDSVDTMTFFESLGVPLKTERGNRVFPVSDKASDIVNALRRYAGVCVKCGHRVVSLITGNSCGRARISGVRLENGCEFYSDAVILATGGMSYHLTGSDGEGYKLAESVGHSIVTPKPSLVPLEVKEKWCALLQGLSLRNVALRIADCRNESEIVYEDFGELLFTHFGLSGPVILSASSHINKDTASERYKAIIDLKPSLDEKTLDNRLISDFEKYSNKNFSNALDDLLPKKLIPVIINLSGISPDCKVHDITREQRRSVLKLLKSFTLTIKATRPIEEAIVTSGGVNTKEISPKTMESKLVAGLYFAGELIDVDAYTGGFNLQIAFSTAVRAAESAFLQIKS